MAYIDNLVRLYAKNLIADIKASPALIEAEFQTPLNELALKPGFSTEQEFVEGLKVLIEARMSAFTTADVKGQISQCLRLLLERVWFDKEVQSKVFLKLDTLRSLFLEMFGGNWSQKQKEHFDFVFERLKEWHSYFLSYTNEGGNIINDKYTKVVDLYTEPEVLKERNWSLHNLLADAIINSLRKRAVSRRGFYDKEKIPLAANLRPTIFHAAGKTFLFVQLVQLETFDTTRDVNWCFEEYTSFDTYNEQELKNHGDYRDVFMSRFAAVLTGDKKDLMIPFIPFQYESWVKRIFNDAHFLTLPVDTDGFATAMQTLSAATVHTVGKIIDNVPS